MKMHVNDINKPLRKILQKIEMKKLLELVSADEVDIQTQFEKTDFKYMYCRCKQIKCNNNTR